MGNEAIEAGSGVVYNVSRRARSRRPKEMPMKVDVYSNQT